MTISKDAIILPYQGKEPQIDASAFVMAGSVIIGDVMIGPQTSIWPGVVIRGDDHAIRIGANANIQDGSVIHVTKGGQGTHIGDNVTVGHMSLLHDCTVEAGAFVGMRGTLLDGARMAPKSMLAAGALLTQGKVIETGQMWVGSPAKYWRDITEEEAKEFAERAGEYAALAKSYSHPI